MECWWVPGVVWLRACQASSALVAGPALGDDQDAPGSRGSREHQQIRRGEDGPPDLLSGERSGEWSGHAQLVKSPPVCLLVVLFVRGR